MKKLLFALPVVLLVAAGCNSTSQTTTGQNPSAQQTQNQTQAQQQVAQNPTPTPTPTPTKAASNKCPDNDMNCLIVAAAKCQATSAVVAYSLPNVFLPELTETGQSKYEIKPYSDGNCLLVTTVFSYSVSISNSNRKILLAGTSASGRPAMTDDQINAIIQQGNSSSSQSGLNIPVPCKGTMVAVSSYLTDVQNHKQGQSMHTITNLIATGSVTLKTSSGQNLSCSTSLLSSTK